MIQKRMLRNIFGSKKDLVMAVWGKRHNEELRDLYTSPCVIRIIKPRRMRWEESVVRIGKKRNAYRLLMGIPERKRPLGRTGNRWVHNIKMDLVKIE
jgi:hypothetical protein